MENVKGLEQLREQLLTFETDVLSAIKQELTRIKRAVKIEEFNSNPFRDDIQWYMDTIRLDEDKEPVMDTAFADVNEKTLEQSLCDSEIGHWDIISLLESLTHITR